MINSVFPVQLTTGRIGNYTPVVVTAHTVLSCNSEPPVPGEQHVRVEGTIPKAVVAREGTGEDKP